MLDLKAAVIKLAVGDQSSKWLVKCNGPDALDHLTAAQLRGSQNFLSPASHFEATRISSRLHVIYIILPCMCVLIIYIVYCVFLCFQDKACH